MARLPKKNRVYIKVVSMNTNIIFLGFIAEGVGWPEEWGITVDGIAPAYDCAFTPSNIKAPFHATGIHPFNTAVIIAKEMAPSKATAKRNPFPGATPMVIRKTVNFIMTHLSTLWTTCAQPAPPPCPQFHKDTTPLLPRSSQQLPLSASSHSKIMQ